MRVILALAMAVVDLTRPKQRADNLFAVSEGVQYEARSRIVPAHRSCVAAVEERMSERARSGEREKYWY